MDFDKYKNWSFNQTVVLNALERLGGSEINLQGGGVCTQLALKWLKVKLKELASGESKDPMHRHEKITSLNTMAKAIERNQTQTPLRQERDYNLNAILTLPNPGFAKAMEYITSNKQACFLLTFNCPGYGEAQHSIGTYRSSGKILGLGVHVYFFDPDEGEYKVPVNIFPEFFSAFIKKYYGSAETDLVYLSQLSLR